MYDHLTRQNVGTDVFEFDGRLTRCDIYAS